MTTSNIFVLPGSSKEGKKKNEYVRDLNFLSIKELLELLERQNKLIHSPALKKLADKGEKVLFRKQQIEEELNKRNKSADLCDEFTKLSIQEKTVEVIEWGEKEVNTRKKSTPNEEDPLAILATHSGTVHNQRQVIEEEPDEPLVTLEDIEDAYALNLCYKIDKIVSKGRYLPHKTLNHTKTATKIRDLSAATPPLAVFGDAKLLSLEESLKLQFEQTQHMKDVQLKQATERLYDLHKYRLGSILPKEESMKTYRVPNVEYNEEEIDEENNEEE